MPCIEQRTIREVISPVWKSDNTSIMLLIREYIDIKLVEQGTAGYMTSCRKKLVVLSISAYQFISRALDVGGIKSAQT
jgi:hypothetical protein